MIANQKPYSAYKDSGVEWLGEVPQHWEVVPLKRVGWFSSGAGFPISAQGNVQGEIPFAKVSDMNRPGNDREIVSVANAVTREVADELGANEFPQGTIVFPKVGGALLTNKRRILVRGTCIDNNLMGCVVTGADTEFTFRILRWLDLGRIAKPGPVPAISEGEIKELRVQLPPLSEQFAIVRFLDHAERRIRRYIRSKERLIELLEEQKQAIIHQAVTGQIDVRTGQPYPAYKDSGVEWLGKVPVHWHVIALKRILDLLVDCEHKTAPAVDESEYRVVRTTAVRRGRLRWEGTYCTSKEAFLDWTKRTSPEPGDVVFTREAPVGESCVVPEGTRVCLGQRTVLMRPIRGEYDPDFLVHVIYTGPPRHQVRLASQGSTVGHFNMKDIGSLRVLKPPFDEQLRIKNEIGKQMYDLDLAVARTVRQVSLLQEYRTRLIADVVTGKLDVRELAASLAEVEPLAAVEDTLDGSVRGIPEANLDKPNPTLA